MAEDGPELFLGVTQPGYYNKEYREGFPRECLLTAAVSESPNPKGEVIHSLPR